MNRRGKWEIVRALAHEGIRPQSEGENLPRPDQDRALESALGEFRAILPANGKGDGDEDTKEYSEYFREFEEAARQLGVVRDGLQPDVIGGREHDLTYDPTTGSVLKYTKASAAAYVVNFELGPPRLATAMPLEYLERQILHNQIFADDIRFVCLAGNVNKRRIVTRQTHIEGAPANWDEIERFMIEDLGFLKLRHTHGIGYDQSLAFTRDDVAVFDMRPANVIRTPSGLIVPIDCIPVALTTETRKTLRFIH